ncbi:hypothetical protein ILYODFUR_005302 [Ilyodon furcidens]|uniref:Uncharacterized protein n=1 Tax=Ilyodon furcidens TaxID=33524 RepID=A0ABV0TTD5_9TELE
MYERVRAGLHDWPVLKSRSRNSANAAHVVPLPPFVLTVSHSGGGTRGQSTLLLFVFGIHCWTHVEANIHIYFFKICNFSKFHENIFGTALGIKRKKAYQLSHTHCIN